MGFSFLDFWGGEHHWLLWRRRTLAGPEAKYRRATVRERREEILRCRNQIFLRIKSRRGLIKNTVCWGEVGK
jgi:hypothetical protein